MLPDDERTARPRRLDGAQGLALAVLLMLPVFIDASCGGFRVECHVVAVDAGPDAGPDATPLEGDR